MSEIVTLGDASSLQGLTILPDSRAREGKGAVWVADRTQDGQFIPAHFEVPIYCASCGKGPAGTVPEENVTYIFYLCTPCFQTHGELTNVAFMPDDVFFKEVERAQMEKYGRCLSGAETEASLADPDSLESLLLRSKKALTPSAGS